MTTTTTTEAKLHQWIAPEDVLPGYVVHPNGNQHVSLEVEEVVPLLDTMTFEEARAEVPETINPHDVIVLRGWLTNWQRKDDLIGQRVDNCRHIRGRRSLWLVNSLRDLIAYE